MLLDQLRDWLESLPDEFEEYPVVLCDAIEISGQILIETDSESMLAIEVDREHQEIVLRHENNTQGIEMPVWNLAQLKAWAREATKDFGSYSCVIGESWLDHSTLLWGRLDKIVDTCDVDEDEHEVVIASVRDPEADVQVSYE